MFGLHRRRKTSVTVRRKHSRIRHPHPGTDLLRVLQLALHDLQSAVGVRIGDCAGHLLFAAGQAARFFLPFLNQRPVAVRVSAKGSLNAANRRIVDAVRLLLRVRVGDVAPVGTERFDRRPVNHSTVDFCMSFITARGIDNSARASLLAAGGPRLVSGTLLRRANLRDAQGSRQ